MNDHVSPEAMVERLAGMSKLKSLTIEFQYPTPPPTWNFRARAILPSLTQFQFRGDYRYLEDLVAQLDTPRLFDLTVIVMNTMADCSGVKQNPQLFLFIDRAEDLKLSQFRRARAKIHNSHCSIHFDDVQSGQCSTYLTLGQEYNNSVWPMGALLSQASAITSSVHHLSFAPSDRMRRDIYRKHAGLLSLLRSFDSVETLHVGGHFTNVFPPMLNHLSDELVAELLPALRLVNFEGKPLKLAKTRKLAPFIKKWQFIGHPPLTIVRTCKDFEMLRALSDMEDRYP